MRISLQFVLIVDNEEELFNPNCVTVNLLDNLRRRCGCQKGSMLPYAVSIYAIELLIRDTALLKQGVKRCLVSN